MLATQEEERRKKLERQERLHQNYLKRKASGKQQEYDRKYNEKRKAMKAAGIAPRPRKRTPEEQAAQAEYRKAYMQEYNREYHR